MGKLLYISDYKKDNKYTVGEPITFDGIEQLTIVSNENLKKDIAFYNSTQWEDE